MTFVRFPALILLSATAFVPAARAEPKCLIEAKVIIAISPDGRYALGTSDDGLGARSLDLLDLARGGLPLISAGMTQDELSAAAEDPPLEVGALRLRPKERWKVLKGTLHQVATRVAARCPAVAPRAADGRDFDPNDFRRAYSGSRFVALLFEVDIDGCDSDHGDVMVGFPCGRSVADALTKEDEFVGQGSPEVVRERIAREIYKRKKDPLGALRLLTLLRNRLGAGTPKSLLFAVMSDELLYLSRLGEIGRKACREDGKFWVEQRPEPGEAPVVTRLRDAIKFNVANCSDAP